MPTLQEQLKALEQQEEQNSKTFKRIENMKSWLSAIVDSDSCLIPIIFFSLSVFILWLIFPQKDAITYCAASYFISMLLNYAITTLFKKPLVNLVHNLYGIDKDEFQKLSALKTKILLEKNDLKKQIKEIEKRTYRIPASKIETTKPFTPTEKDIPETANPKNNISVTKTTQQSIASTQTKEEPSKSSIIKIDPPKPTNIQPQNTEQEISDLFPVPTETQKEKATPTFRIRLKKDYEALNNHRQEVGKLGEKFVVELEKNFLKMNNRYDLADRVMWVSEKSDSYGYDIISYELDGRIKYIEVKTTTEGKRAPFYISEHELDSLNSMDNYVIHRVYDFNIEKEKGSKFQITKENLPLYYDIEPVTFKANPKF